MISAERLNSLLEGAIKEGLDGIVLMTVSGTIIASAISTENRIEDISLAAITSSVWNNYQQTLTGNEIFFHLVRLDSSYLGISAVGKAFLLAGIGNVPPGLMRLILQHLREVFEKVFQVSETTSH